MPNPLKVLIASHSKEALESIQGVLRQQINVKSAARHLTNGHVDPLHGVRELPDVLMLQVSHNWEHELEALNLRPPTHRPAVLAIGPSDDPNLLRRAMQAGVRDFLSLPVDPAEVSAALEKIQQEKRLAQSAAPQRITAVLNAKGGAGATLVASNTAHIMVEQLNLKAALVDLDLQFGTCALCLNLDPRVGIKDALSAAHEIDAVALRGYLTRHKSGLDVLTNLPNDSVELNPPSPDQLDQLLTVIGENYDHTVIDVPRFLHPLTLKAVARADRILVVLQQQLSQLHDAKRLVTALRGYLEGVDARLTVVINRFNKNASISVRDVEDALGVDFNARIPGDYKRVCQAEEMGEPLLTHAPSAPVTKALCNLARNLSGIAPVKRGLFGRMFAEHQP